MKIIYETYNDYLKKKIPQNDFTKWKDLNERTLFRHKEFILIHDKKWKDNDIDNLHLLAIPFDDELKSLRNLSLKHLYLLKTIKNLVEKYISDNYKIKKNQILSYVHYYPTIWHLHIHFQNINKKDNTLTEINVGRAHLLHDIIKNIEMNGEYYKQMTIEIIDDKK